MTSGGFSSKRLARVRDVLSRHVDAGYVPGAVGVVARHGEVHIEATGNLAFEGEGSRTPMAADMICRTGSMTKPVVAACAMTLVEDCTLRLDDPVDEFLPELADMSVLADPSGPLEDTVPAKRPITRVIFRNLGPHQHILDQGEDAVHHVFVNRHSAADG